MSLATGRDDFELRWMIRRDLEECEEIERLSFPDCPWKIEDFIEALRERNTIGLVCTVDNGDLLVGYVVYALYRSYIRLENLAVHPDCRRFGVGAALIERLKKKLSSKRRKQLLGHVRETNMPALQFLKAQGFVAVKCLRNAIPELEEDAYVMRYDHVRTLPEVILNNRMSFSA